MDVVILGLMSSFNIETLVGLTVFLRYVELRYFGYSIRGFWTTEFYWLRNLMYSGGMTELS